MNLMVQFLGRKRYNANERMDRLDKAAIASHKKNLSTIANARQKADTLKAVLEDNHITIQIHKATTGNKHEPNLRPA